MTTIVQPLPHDLAVIAALEATVVADDDGTLVPVTVGYATAPEGALEAVQNRTGPDYLIAFPLNSLRDGTLADPFRDGEFVYQITCVGRLAAGVRYLVGQLEAALAGITITGRSVLQVIPEDDGAVRPDTDVVPPVFIATPRYRLSTVPT